MRCLFVEIVAGDVLIGTADLSPSDPSMGVAFATFQPSSAYAVDMHARATERRELAEPPTQLSARTKDGLKLVCAGVDLVDFAETLGPDGREVHVLGLEDFQLYFG